jgi:hypothetical protein
VTWLRRLTFVTLLMVSPKIDVSVMTQQSSAQDAYVPVSNVPEQDRLPAAPLLIAGYSVVVLALFVYVWSVARRLVLVRHDIDRLEAGLKQRNQ